MMPPGIERLGAEVFTDMDDAVRDGDRVYAIVRSADEKAEGALTLGDAQADIGHAGAATGLAAVVKACLCLHQEILPPFRDGDQTQHDEHDGFFGECEGADDEVLQFDHEMHDVHHLGADQAEVERYLQPAAAEQDGGKELAAAFDGWDGFGFRGSGGQGLA